MRHSAQIQVHFKSYQRFGGALDLNAYMKMADWLKRSRISIQHAPKGIRNAFFNQTGHTGSLDRHPQCLPGCRPCPGIETGRAACPPS